MNLNASRNAAAGAVLFALALLGGMIGCSALQPGGPSLQGTWLWKSDRTPLERGVKAILAQQGATVSGRAALPDGSDYLLLEGSVSENGVASFSTFWKGVFVPDPGDGPCPDSAVAQFYQKYQDAKHPGYARGTMVLNYDARTNSFVGTKSYFHVVCQGGSLARVDVPNESVSLTRAQVAGDQEQQLFTILGACIGFACVILILVVGGFLFLRSRRGSMAQVKPGGRSG